MARLASQQLAVLVAELIKQFPLEALLDLAAKITHTRSQAVILEQVIVMAEPQIRSPATWALISSILDLLAHHLCVDHHQLKHTRHGLMALPHSRHCHHNHHIQSHRQLEQASPTLHLVDQLWVNYCYLLQESLQLE